MTIGGHLFFIFAAIGFLSVLFTVFVVLFCFVAAVGDWINESMESARRLDGPH